MFARSTRRVAMAALFLMLGPAALGWAAGPEVTVYSRDRAFVREVQDLERPSGRDTLQLTDLPKRLDIEHTLWFLALDNVLMDGDGYHYRGSDYAIYMHPDGRFYPLFRDNNEAFGYGGGPGGFGRGSSRRPPGERGAKMNPVGLAKEERAALSYALLKVPKWRQAYLDRCRTIRDTWLDWNKVGPIVAGYRKMIEPIIKKDDKSLYGYDAFVAAIEKGSDRRPGLRRFLEERREFLDAHASLK